MTRMRLPVALLAALAISVFPQVASADLLSTTTSTVTSTTSTTTSTTSTFNAITDWSSLLPTLADPYEPNDPNNICNAGNPQCVQSVAREMTKRLQPLSDSCDHNALFAFLYLTVTNHIYTAVTTPGYFQVPGVISHEDALFASYYFSAFDNYSSGNLAATPYAWQVALNAAKSHSEQGIGDLLLGMNAHINRDLPFVLYRMGLYNADGTSRKPDHDQVNNVLYDAYDEAITKGAQRYDPSLAQYEGSTSDDSGIQTVIAWREEAWRNAERLASAPDDATRAQIAQQIEQAADVEADTLAAAYAYPPGQTSATRDAYCAIHHNDA
jgi:Family of unknown function (DUF5995)